jgi:hypothetical protein
MSIVDTGYAALKEYPDDYKGILLMVVDYYTDYFSSSDEQLQYLLLRLYALYSEFGDKVVQEIGTYEENFRQQGIIK